MALLLRLPTVEGWARADTVQAEERVVLAGRACTAPPWFPGVRRVPKTDPDPLSRFNAIGIHLNRSQHSPTGGTVRATLGEDAENHTVSLPWSRLQHACYEGAQGCSHPLVQGKVDVRLLQLMRDVARLTREGAFLGGSQRAPVKVHAATAILLQHTGISLSEPIPLGSLVVLYVWAFAQVKYPLFQRSRKEKGDAWLAACAASIAEGWTLLQMCTWREVQEHSAVFLSVLAALPQKLLLSEKNGFDQGRWADLLEEGFCSKVCFPASRSHCFGDVFWHAYGGLWPLVAAAADHPNMSDVCVV